MTPKVGVATVCDETDVVLTGYYASCRGCPRLWRGLAECHCSACHEHFAGITLFDLHRRNGKCLSPGKIKTEKGRKLMVRKIRPNGPIWSSPQERKIA